MSSDSRHAGHRSAVLFGVLAILMAGIVPRVAQAVNTCNGLFTIDYVAGPNFAKPGDTLRVKLSLGTGSITGGTMMTVNRLRFDLDCNDNFTLGLPCTDEGMIVEYEGDGTITTTCPTVWSTGHPVSANPNEVVFTATPSFGIPPNQVTPPGFCSVEFDVKVLGQSVDNSPNDIQEVTGYLTSQNDAMCDNMLSSTGQQSGSIPLCPTCDDNNDCTDNVCNQNDGTCTNPPKQDSTPCADTDNNACTTAGCDGAGTCDQNHMVVSCPPDGNPCTDDLGCNPQSGQCQYPPTQASTPCPDTDQDACTTAGCDGAGTCDQSHIVMTCPPPTSECVENGTCNPQSGQCVYPPKQDSTPCTDTDNNACTTAGCNGQGTCDQSHVVCVTTTTSTTTTTATTTTTLCTPTGSEAGNCRDLIDNDCNGLIDCEDPACINTTPCLPARKDPTSIHFGKGGHLDRFRSHATLDMAFVDVMSRTVAVLLTNPSGELYRGVLEPGDLTPNATGTLFLYRDLGARTGQAKKDGIYILKIKQNKTGYTFSLEAYGDLSAATDPNMRVQFYIGQVNSYPAFITTPQPWKQTAFGWKAPKDH